MNKIAVVYKSKYGTTKRYAEWIAQELDAELIEVSAIKPAQLASYGLVIYGGGLYAGGISGVDKLVKNPPNSLIVFTVGLADPNSTDYSDIIKRSIHPELLEKIKIFHLRGGIDYSELKIIHKAMMSMLKNMIRKKNELELSDEDRLFLEAYGGKIDFTDKDTIEPIVRLAKQGF